MADGFSVRRADLDQVAARLARTTAELGGTQVPVVRSGQRTVDGAVELFASAWSTGLAALVDEVDWCAGQVRACEAAYAEVDATAAASFRVRPE